MNKQKHAWPDLFCLVLASVFVWDAICVAAPCFTPDRDIFLAWAKAARDHGIGQIYQASTPYNYPPLMAYALWIFAKVMGSDANLAQNFFVFKLLPLAFDFAAAGVAAKWAATRWRALVYLLLLIANPLYLFDSYSWGQVDSIYCALVFFSLYEAVLDRPVGALLFYVLAINFKIQALLFAPLLALVWLWKFKNPWPLKHIATALVAAALLQLVIVLPFIRAGELGHMIAVIKNPVNYYHAVSMNADNFWHLFYGSAALKMDDHVAVLAGFSAQTVGLALFFGFALIVLGPFFIRTMKAKFSRQPPVLDTANVLLVFSLIPLGFFFFCTQMHERYAQPAILFIAVYSFLTRRYVPLLLAFAAFGLNMEGALEIHPATGYPGLLYNTRFIASLYAILIFWLSYLYYSSLNKTALTTPPRMATR